MHTLTVREAAALTKMSVDEFAETYPDLLSCFNREILSRALYSLFAATKKENESVTTPEICRGFLDLLDRGVLVPEFKLTAIAQEDLLTLRSQYLPQTTASDASPLPENRWADLTRAALDRMATGEMKMRYKSDAQFRAKADELVGRGCVVAAPPGFQG